MDSDSSSNGKNLAKTTDVPTTKNESSENLSK